MGRYFNTEGLCNPKEHYMVRLDDRVSKIKELFVDRGKYFVINRGRQYGKTTTLRALAAYLKEEYIVCSMDFQQIGTDEFRDERAFAHAFGEILVDILNNQKLENKKELVGPLAEFVQREERGTLGELFVQISEFCGNAPKPVILMIDEADSASNHWVFLDFLAQLRGYYLGRKDRSAFHSVIFAGVHDICNLSPRMCSEEVYRHYSPWNIAARFNIDMSFSAEQIAKMLQEYEEDHGIGMNVYAVAKCVYEYTSGYPYLVSAICKLLDEEIPENCGFEDMKDVWTKEGIDEAVKILLRENMSLLNSVIEPVNKFKDLRSMLKEMLYRGKQIPYSPDIEFINAGKMFGLLKREGSHVIISNRIFEMCLHNMFMTEESMKGDTYRYE